MAMAADYTRSRFGVSAADRITEFIAKAPYPQSPGQHGLRPQPLSVDLPGDSSPGGFMAKQTKPFTIEIKQSRKLKTDSQKLSIWGSLDLRMADDRLPDVDRTDETAAIAAGDRSEQIR
jgi:hypothetical protein